MLEKISQTDDPKKLWPKEELLSSLGMPTRIKSSVCAIIWRDQEMISLHDVFELIISDERDPRPGYLISKLLDQRNVGKKSFLAIVDHLHQLNLGTQCNQLWDEKYQRFLNADRVKGSSCQRWAFAISEKGGKYAIWKKSKGDPQPIRYGN
jgi:hypothetical protein